MVDGPGGFGRDFYGCTMRLVLGAFLRPEQKFDAFPLLVAQVGLFLRCESAVLPGRQMSEGWRLLNCLKGGFAKSSFWLLLLLSLACASHLELCLRLCFLGRGLGRLIRTWPMPKPPPRLPLVPRALWLCLPRSLGSRRARRFLSSPQASFAGR